MFPGVFAVIAHAGRRNVSKLPKLLQSPVDAKSDTDTISLLADTQSRRQC